MGTYMMVYNTCRIAVAAAVAAAVAGLEGGRASGIGAWVAIR